jgi:Fe-S cluster assembly scaffold protein SufB
MPAWANLKIPEIKYQEISFYAAPRQKIAPSSLSDVDPELIKTFNKLGIPLEEQKHLTGVAVDAVMDSISVKTTFRETLAEMGIIFCSFSEAVKEHPSLVQKRSTRPFSLTVHSVIYPKASGVLWSCRPTSASMPPTPDSSSVHCS